MDSNLHAGLQSLGSLYFSGKITEEEWALLQIHMAYCDPCYEGFRQLSLNGVTDPDSARTQLIEAKSPMRHRD